MCQVQKLTSSKIDGIVVVFDLETNGVACKLQGHTKPIQSLRYTLNLWPRLSRIADNSIRWSRDGRYLLTSSLDCKCILWDLKDGSRVRMVRFETPVYVAELHPFNQYVYIYIQTFFSPVTDILGLTIVSFSSLHCSKTNPSSSTLRTPNPSNVSCHQSPFDRMKSSNQRRPRNRRLKMRNIIPASQSSQLLETT